MCDYLSVIEQYNRLLEDEINERKCASINLQNIPQYPTIGNKPHFFLQYGHEFTYL